MLKYFIKREVIIGCFILALLVLFVCTNNLYRTKFNLKRISLKNIGNYFVFKEDVKTTFTANMGTDYILKMGISFPCNNRKQYAELTNNIPRIISDFIIESDQTELETWIQQKNLSAIKTRLLKIANKYTDTPVTTVFFESFNW